jgi:hypothetical protein
MIIAIVCGSTVSFLGELFGHWAAHYAKARITRTDTLLVSLVSLKP